MGSSTKEIAGVVIGVVIFDDLEDSLTAVEFASDYLKSHKDYKLCIIHVIREGNQDPPPTDEGILSWEAIEQHFKSAASPFVLKQFQDILKWFNESISVRIFIGNDRQDTLQRAINSLAGLHTLVLGWPKQADGAEPQQLNLSTTGCFIVVVPQKKITTRVSVELRPAVAAPPAPSASAAQTEPQEPIAARENVRLDDSESNQNPSRAESNPLEAENPPGAG